MVEAVDRFFAPAAGSAAAADAVAASDKPPGPIAPDGPGPATPRLP
jgi:hypothetical protein